ncbi:MAG: ribosome biogenesis GTPase Der [Candidatus Dormibacteraeota bacterium]|nr:ribosome biogenesis GTPase Der [Candidatus Dormibacteraeota bacterium]
MTAAAGARRRTQRRARPDETLEAPSGIVAIVGRPNVGKSTLFNRLTGTQRAIVDEMAGLTRDRLYGVVEWRGRAFTVIDTAGLDPRPDPAAPPDIAALVTGTQAQARAAIVEADVIALVLDVRAGVTALDEDIATIVRSGGKPVLLVGNKAESDRDPHFAHELYGLGLGEPMLVSALQGRDTGDLLDAMVAALPPPRDPRPDGAAAELRIAIIGRPNTGKSSLLNALVGQERTLVSPVAGTTRDVVDTVLDFEGRTVRLVDTAGIRRRGLVDNDVERYSLLRSLRALERADVAVLVMDASQGVVAQDRHVAGYAADAGTGLVVVANKWDLVPQESRARPSFLKEIGAGFHFVPGAPVLTLSATEGRNVDKVLATAARVGDARGVHAGTGALNTVIRDAVDEHPPRTHKGRKLRILYATQARGAVPTFVLFVNDPALLHFAYSRYLENRIREAFGFDGVRLRIVTRRRDDAGD